MSRDTAQTKINAPRKRDKNSSGLVRINFLQNIFETGLEFGYDFGEDLAALGITRWLIEEGDAYISMKNVAECLSIAAEKTQRNDFPLLLASRQDLTSAALATLALRTAPTLGDSFRDVVRFGQTYAQSVNWILDTSENREKLLISIDPGGLTPEQHRICSVFVLATTHKFVGAIVGAPPNVERVYFAFAKLDSAVPLSRHFRAPVEFESEILGFEFVKGTLDKPLAMANPDLHTLVLNQLSEPGYQVNAPLDKRVRTVIRSLLPTQKLNIEHVARSFGCSTRTLQRWLNDEVGVTYKVLVEEVRFELAQQFLGESNMSIVDISLAVGYSNPTNFTRGFKRVFGCSPREWRKRQKADWIRESLC